MIALCTLWLGACTSPSADTPHEGGSATRLHKTTPKIENRHFSPEVLWAFGRLGEYSVSPDGKQVAYAARWYDMAANRGFSDLFVMDIAGGTPRQITDLNSFCANVAWGQDGKIRFISGHEGSAQIYSISPEGEGLTCLSAVENGVDGFRISPDGKMVAYATKVKALRSPRDKYPDLDKTSGQVYTDMMYRHWDSWDDGMRSHLFVAPLEGLKTQAGEDLLAGTAFDTPLPPFGGMEEIGWTADSEAVAYTCKKLTGKAAAFSTNSDIYLYDLATKETKNLTAPNPGYDRCPSFSPDGRYMAWVSMARGGFEADKARLMLMDLQDGSTRDLSEKFDYSAGSLTWSADSQTLYFVSGVRGTYQLYRQGLGDAMPTAITKGQHDYHDVALTATGLLASRVSMVHPAELYTVTEDGQATQLTTIDDALLQAVDMPSVRERWVKTTDGKEMLTWVVYPLHFDSTKAYPTILYCQGGPQSPLSQFWSYRWNLALMAAQGYIVVAPNRRGVLTFGQEWTDQISKHHGEQEMQDLLAAIDDVAKEPWCDENRMGAVGASYGGFTVYWLEGHHNKRFKAFISHCGVFNSEMEFYTTEEMFFDHWEMGGAPWDKENAVAQKSFGQSPHKFVQKWDTPLLVIHGGHDFRIPYTQGMAAFNAAQMLGVESKLLYFEDESHWVLKPQNGLLWQREFFDWLDSHLKK